MQQKGRTEQILDRLKEMINNGQGALPTGKVSVPKEEFNRLILELGLTMETELKQYREITDKRARVLREAKKQADDIIYEAEQSASRIRISGRKTPVAPIRMMDLEESERRSLDNANEIYAASLIYTDEMMAEMQDVIEDACEQITESYENAIRDLREKSEVIAANRKELMEDLKGMEKEDRYQQIMEIGQLLSEELYYARKRALGEDTAALATDMPEDTKIPIPEKTPEDTKIPAAEETPEDTKMPVPEETPEDTKMPVPEKTPEDMKMPVPEKTPEEISLRHEEWAANLQQEAAAAVADALEDKKKVDVEVEEITEEVSEAVKKDVQPSLSASVLEAMKRAAKKAVTGMEEEDDMLSGEEEEIKQPMTPEQVKQEKHRAFVEAHEEKVRAEEEKWLNAVYDPVIPNLNAVDPIVAMVLKEKQEAKKHNESDEL